MAFSSFDRGPRTDGQQGEHRKPEANRRPEAAVAPRQDRVVSIRYVSFCSDRPSASARVARTNERPVRLVRRVRRADGRTNGRKDGRTVAVGRTGRAGNTLRSPGATPTQATLHSSPLSLLNSLPFPSLVRKSNERRVADRGERGY